MSVEENKANARRAVAEFWNKGNMALLDEFWATNYVNHDPSKPRSKRF